MLLKLDPRRLVEQARVLYFIQHDLVEFSEHFQVSLRQRVGKVQLASNLLHRSDLYDFEGVLHSCHCGSETVDFPFVKRCNC